MTEPIVTDAELAELENEKILELKEKLIPTPLSVEERLTRVLVVDNLPKVGPEKLQKLQTVLEKIFNVGAKAQIAKNGAFLPVNPNTKETYGYAFVEFASPEDAQNALEKVNGYKLDKDFTLAINYWPEIARLQKIPEEYTPPAETPYKPLENLRWWLTDPCGLDQYAVTFGDEMEIYWAETLRKPRRAHARSRAHEKYADWSPYGSYLTTVHKDAVKLWGGETWVGLKVFSHPEVERIEYSPNEQFLVTASRIPSRPNIVLLKVCVWEVSTGKLVKEFDNLEVKRDEVIFKWTHDAKYFARLGVDCITVYESSTMELVKGKPVEISGVSAFEWCPTAHYLAAFVPSFNENPPAYLTMHDVPTGMELYRKTLFSVLSVELQWQSAGKYLGLKVERQTTKNKKKTSFEIFTTVPKGVSLVVTTQIQNMDDTVNSWKWEPKGNRFAVIHGEENAPRVKVSFYQLTPKDIVHKRTFENKPAKRLFWSPVGGIVIIACNQGVMEFYSSSLDEIIGTGEHPLATDLVWDPTGRYVCTFVDGHRQQMDNGYMIHTFKGNVIHRVLKDRFYQFLWRPRPPTLLSVEQQKEINKNINSIAEKYKKQDAGSITVIIDEQLLERQRLLQQFKDFIVANRAVYEEQREERIRIRDGRLSDDEDEYDILDETYEELIEETITEQ